MPDLEKYRQYSRFFLPLALQAATQSLSYPLVAMVASRGEGGTLNLAGLAQANSLMWLLGTLGFGLMTTGIVFGKSRESFEKFIRVNYIVSLVTIVLQALLCLPPISHGIFGTIIGLPPSIEHPARMTLLAMIPVNFLFFVRNPYQIALLLGKATGRASGATLGRIALTALLVPIFIRLGWVGPYPAVICLTLPVALEVVISRLLAKPYLHALPAISGSTPRLRELFAFTLPLSAGGLFLSLSGILLGAFIARAPQPERMLPVYYLALSLANPMSFGCTNIQRVVLSFPPAGPRDRSTLLFAVTAGSVLGLLPLLFLLPPLSDLYYVHLQKLPAGDLGTLRVTALLLGLLPLSVALRAQSEGLAANLRKPVTVLAGLAVYLGSEVTVGFFMLALNTPGYLIGPLGLITGNIAATLTERMSLNWERQNDIPVPPTRVSQEGR